MDDASSMSMLANEPSFATRANFAQTRQKNPFASAGAPRSATRPLRAGPPGMHGIINTTNHIISYQFLEGGRT